MLSHKTDNHPRATTCIPPPSLRPHLVFFPLPPPIRCSSTSHLPLLTSSFSRRGISRRSSSNRTRISVAGYCVAQSPISPERMLHRTRDIETKMTTRSLPNVPGIPRPHPTVALLLRHAKPRTSGHRISRVAGGNARWCSDT